jgi:hypothetical protein
MPKGLNLPAQLDLIIVLGAIDGILIWMLKPTAKETKKAGVGQKYFFLWKKEQIRIELSSHIQPPWQNT